MISLEIERTSVNMVALHADLKAVFGEQLVCVSRRPGHVIVHLTEDASNAAQAEQIVRSHDASRLTAKQQAKRQRDQELSVLRTAQVAPLDLSTFASTDELVQMLANKLYWLELELRELRQV